MVQADNASSVGFRLTQSGTTKFSFTLDANIVDIRFTPVYWGDAVDVSLSGRKRSNIRGLDVNISADFNASLKPAFVETFLEGLVDLINPEYKLEFTLDDTNYYEIYPTDGINVLVEYRDTIRTGGPDTVIPTLDFEGAEYVRTVDAFTTT